MSLPEQTPEQITEILESRTITQQSQYSSTSNNLNRLLTLPNLTDKQRTLLITGTKINSELSDINTFKKLLEIPTLTDEQRTSLISKTDMTQFIKNVDQLKTLLELPKLTEEHRTQILDSFEQLAAKTVFTQSNDLKMNYSELKRLLQSTMLTPQHKTQILNIGQKQLTDMNIDGYMLRGLLTIPGLAQESASQILSAVRGGLGTVVQDYNQLLTLLSIPEQSLTSEQRSYLLDAVNDKLTGLINNRDQLMSLFQLPETQLNTEHRQTIITAIESKIASFGLNDKQLEVISAYCKPSPMTATASLKSQLTSLKASSASLQPDTNETGHLPNQNP